MRRVGDYLRNHVLARRMSGFVHEFEAASKRYKANSAKSASSSVALGVSVPRYPMRLGRIGLQSGSGLSGVPGPGVGFVGDSLPGVVDRWPGVRRGPEAPSGQYWLISVALRASQ
jgi:hypothetical protein